MNVVKVNIGADIVRAWIKGINEGISMECGEKPPHEVMLGHAEGRVSKVARLKLSLMGASRHAEPLSRRLSEANKDFDSISTPSPLAKAVLQR